MATIRASHRTLRHARGPNQPPPLAGRNLFEDNAPLVEALEREGAGWAPSARREVGAFWGGEPMRSGASARTSTRRCCARTTATATASTRSSSTRLAPAHGAERARRAARAALAAPTARARHVARAALYMTAMQAEAGFGCPMTMTFAAIPALRDAARARRRVGAAADRDGLRPASSRPASEKGSALVRDGDDREAGRLGRAREHDDRDAAERRRAGRRVRDRGHKWFCSAPMCDLFLVLAQTDEGISCFARAADPARRHAQRVPHPAPQGQARQPLQRLERGRVPRRLGAAWSASRAAACRRSSRWSATRGWTACSARAAGMRAAVAEATWHAAHRSAFGKLLVDQPLMRNVLADLAIESEAATALALRLARAYDPTDDDAARRTQAPGHRRSASTGSASARPSHAVEALECLGGNGYVEESGHAAALPRGAAELDLGGLGQRQGARRPARAGPHARRAARPSSPRSSLAAGADARLDAFVAAPARRSSPTPRRSRRAPAASSSAWRSRCRARCCVRHAPPAVADAFCASRLAGDARHARSARCRRGRRHRRRSSRATRRTAALTPSERP